MSYSTRNLGDDLQTLALERLLPRVDLRVDRDDVSQARDWGDDVRWIINGWYSPNMHRVWPPRTQAQCLYVGFHATHPSVLPLDAKLSIGCRDPWTLQLCLAHDLEAWISWCATLTLGVSTAPRSDEVLLVDVPENILATLPPSIANGTRLTHLLSPDADRRALAEQRLEQFARARWVVTSRLHALLPCAALGTPVAFVEAPNAANKVAGYKHLAWRVDQAPWHAPRVKVAADVVASLGLPLRDAVRRFIEL